TGRGQRPACAYMDFWKRRFVFNLLSGDLDLELAQVFYERGDDLRIKLGSGGSLQVFDRFIAVERAPVLPVLVQRVEAIYDRQDSGRYRDLLAGKPVGITTPVPSLVVIPDDRHNRVGESNSLQYLRADDRVNLHLLELGGGQFAGLVQDVI